MKDQLKLYKVTRIENSGYECDGHWVDYLVYAHNDEEARKLLPRCEDINGYAEYGEEETLFEMPILGRKRKAFIVF